MERQLLSEVKRVMETKGVSQAEYAREKGISRQQINQYLQGNRPLLTETGKELLEFLGVQIYLRETEKFDPEVVSVEVSDERGWHRQKFLGKEILRGLYADASIEFAAFITKRNQIAIHYQWNGRGERLARLEVYSSFAAIPKTEYNQEFLGELAQALDEQYSEILDI